MGKASVKQAGTGENGAVYCHASMFKAYADIISGDIDAAYETVIKTLPSNELNPNRGTQSPVFLPNYYFGVPESDNFGISSNNNSTGTPDWLQWIVVEHILGVKATAEGVKIEPNLPGNWQGAKIARNVNHVRYEIEYYRENGEVKSKISKEMLKI